MKVKVKVIHKYVDKYTHELIEADRVLEYQKERADELITQGYVVVFQEEKVEKKSDDVRR